MADDSSSRIFAPGLLEGQVCVVSGAGSGLGRATALELARLGATVVGCGRRDEPLEETVDEVARRGGRPSTRRWTSATTRRSTASSTACSSATAGSTCSSTTPAASS